MAQVVNPWWPATMVKHLGATADVLPVDPERCGSHCKYLPIAARVTAINKKELQPCDNVWLFPDDDNGKKAARMIYDFCQDQQKGIGLRCNLYKIVGRLEPWT
jgi:hypothetical protein